MGARWRSSRRILQVTVSRSGAVVAAKTAECTCMAGHQDSHVSRMAARGSTAERTRATFSAAMTAPDLESCEVSNFSSE
ncbi:hypothetical protein ADK61_10140 [Streptomyces sp. XY66]|nr:hypothetical protein ADK61_10140 [Streptomyces sp. XY66]